MTKSELLRLLDGFEDDTEVCVVLNANPTNQTTSMINGEITAVYGRVTFGVTRAVLSVSEMSLVQT